VPAQPSGAWFDPAHYGSGFVFEQIDAQNISTIWFGFDSSGNPVWLSGVAQQAMDGSFGGTLAQGVGPRFGVAYDPAAFHFVVQGDLAQTRLSCLSGSAQFHAAMGQPGYIAPLQTLSRITFPLGVPVCGP
jgi:hypothetical protein